MLIGSERPIFIREYSSKTYRLLPYVLSKLFVESPFEVIRTILHWVIPYYALGLRPSFYNFSIFIISQVLNTIVFSSFGLALGNVFSNPNVAVSFAPLILLPSILFSGILWNLGTTTFTINFIF